MDEINGEKNIGKTDEENTVYFVSLLKPGFLRDAIMLGANFQDSLLFDWFTRNNKVTFTEFSPISNKLQCAETSKRNIKIGYLLEEQFFSKYKGNQTTTEGDR